MLYNRIERNGTSGFAVFDSVFVCKGNEFIKNGGHGLEVVRSQILIDRRYSAPGELLRGQFRQQDTREPRKSGTVASEGGSHEVQVIHRVLRKSVVKS
ncbi:MAG: hypothetical protein MZV49_01070 [Rhodopseudomonas palustris]|nr:hypothetical protein [Rhodopseudomonas palustris]